MSRQTTPPLLAAGAATSPARTPAAEPPQATPPAPPQGAPQGPPPPQLGPPAPGFPHGAPSITAQVPPGGPPPSFVAKDRYDGPPAPQRFVLAALAIAGFAGLLVSGNTPGLSLAIVAAAILAATLLLDAPRTRFRWACLAAGGLLAIVPAVRDSGWVGTLSLLGAMTLGAISVSSPGSWRELGVASLGWMAKLFPAPIRLLARQSGEAAQVRWRSAAPVLRGTLLGLVLLLIFGALFASADARFAQIADDLLSIDLSFETLWERAWIIVLVLACAGALWLTAATRTERPPKPASSKLGATEWLIALGLLAAMFSGFVALQLDVLFGGNDTVQLTDGLTYAEYARQGFGQMTVAAALTLAVVAAAARYGPADQLGVRLLCGVLCVLTLIVLASAMHRLGLYQDAFGSTRVRFSMTALMYWLGAVLLVLVVAGAGRRTALLPRALVLLSAAFAIGTVAVNPDHRIAERNVQRFEQTGQLDAPFLTTLSADAVPALVQLPPRWGACLQAAFADRLDRSETVASWNAGRARARAALDPAVVTAGAAQRRIHGGRRSCPSP